MMPCSKRILNLKKSRQTQGNQEIRDTLKRPNIQIIGREEETKVKSTENTFYKIEEKFPNLIKEMPIKV